MDLSVVEVCAGAGGQSLGLHLAGFKHRLAVEIDEMAARTLRRNFDRISAETGAEPTTVAVGDVAEASVWRPENFRGISLLAGGVPCPPFSIAGKQLGASDERDLFAWAVEAAGRMSPDAVLLENVRGLSLPRFAGYRQAVLDRFAQLGYIADWQLMEARDYGVPQLRPRFVLVALKPEFAPYFRWPDKKPTTETVGSTLLDLMQARGWRGAGRWAARADKVAPTIVGGSKKHGGPDLGPTRARQAWAELGVDGRGVADQGPGPESPMSHMPRLTTEMVQRLQGWYGLDYEWQFEGRKTSVYRQIGNAFPPPVARAVGSSIAAALKKEGDALVPDARDRAAHDEVYRILCDQARFLSAEEISHRLAGHPAEEEVLARVRRIAQDFNVYERTVRGATSFKLGEWKAFRGQADHARHAAFASERQRSKIS